MHPPLPSSFRDPSGFLFWQDGVLYRQVNHTYQPHYDHLMQSGLYQNLVKDGLLIRHQEVQTAVSPPAYCILQPDLVPFISYPYEWSFSQLKNAALTTLALQKRALEFGMSLKDASAYNIQFQNGRFLLIDTLSFELYQEGHPWTAYRQFCQHFLAPLALIAHRDARLSQLLRVHIDGIPLDVASPLLPRRTRLSLPLLLHLHLHANAQKRYAHQTVSKDAPRARMTRTALVGLIDSLETGIRNLRWQPIGDWADYYTDTNYTPAASQHKTQLIQTYLAQATPKTVWDMGANTGKFSRLASDQGIFTLAFDIDAGAVERNYLDCVQNKETHLLPLVMDLTNPSPNLGWHHQERASLVGRASADLVMALALVHHLAIANNVPLDKIAHFFSQLGQWLIIEFVPKGDSQVQRLLATREDIFPDYTQAGFEQAFAPHFAIATAATIQESDRVLYLMKRR